MTDLKELCHDFLVLISNPENTSESKKTLEIHLKINITPPLQHNYEYVLFMTRIEIDWANLLQV